MKKHANNNFFLFRLGKQKFCNIYLRLGTNLALILKNKIFNKHYSRWDVEDVGDDDLSFILYIMPSVQSLYFGSL